MTGSLGDLFAGAALGRLDPASVGRRTGAAVTVALVDEGYPSALVGTGVIEGLGALPAADLQVFHAATTLEGAVCRVTGGRAAYVTALGATIADAGERARAACATLKGHGWRFRRDIAAEVAAPRENESR
ncbi:MAG: phosphoribosylglycinamide synthetase C domain-containing protein [bacterium]